jgi:hypothetical protein
VSKPLRNLCLLGTALLMAVGFAGIEAANDAHARAAERSLRARQIELAARFQAANQEAKAAQRREAAQRRTAAAETITLPAASTAASLSPSANVRAWLAAHPEARARYLRAYRDTLDRSWGILVRALNLSPSQSEQLEDLLAQREDNDITVTAAAVDRGLPQTAPEIQALDDQLDKANKDAIRALVGKTDYAAVHEYMHDEDVLPLVDDLASETYATSTPLSADQGMKLIQILAGNSEKTDSGRAIENTVNWSQAMAQAQRVLSPEQFSTLTTIQQQNLSAQQIRKLEQTLP